MTLSTGISQFSQIALQEFAETSPLHEFIAALVRRSGRVLHGGYRVATSRSAQSLYKRIAVQSLIWGLIAVIYLVMAGRWIWAKLTSQSAQDFYVRTFHASITVIFICGLALVNWVDRGVNYLAITFNPLGRLLRARVQSGFLIPSQSRSN